jgi:hypothetical protein
VPRTDCAMSSSAPSPFGSDAMGSAASPLVVSATGGAFSPGATARGEVVGPGRGRAEASCDVAERIGSLGRARRSAADETEVLHGQAQRRA